MAYKSLLTIISEAASIPQVLAASIALARRDHAHLDVLCLGGDAGQSQQQPFDGDAIVLQQDIVRADRSAAALELRVTSQLKATGLCWSVDSPTVQTGGLAAVIARKAQFTDLVILPNPYGKGAPACAEVLVEAALFKGRVPVLAQPATSLPFGLATAPVGQEVVVAWNQSAAALTAIRAALPMLRAAGHVTIAIIDPQPDSAERSDPGGALSQMLAWHGVRADVAVLAKSLPRVADVLARELRERAADLLVLGAQGHSRFHGVTLGGTTRDVLELAEIPVFMAL